jgi:hypothetical protein
VKTVSQLAHEVSGCRALRAGTPHDRACVRAQKEIAALLAEHEQAAQQRIAEALPAAFREGVEAMRKAATAFASKRIERLRTMREGEPEPIHKDRLSWRTAEAMFIASAIVGLAAIEEAAKR